MTEKWECLEIFVRWLCRHFVLNRNISIFTPKIGLDPLSETLWDKDPNIVGPILCSCFYLTYVICYRPYYMSFFTNGFMCFFIVKTFWSISIYMKVWLQNTGKITLCRKKKLIFAHHELLRVSNSQKRLICVQ